MFIIIWITCILIEKGIHLTVFGGDDLQICVTILIHINFVNYFVYLINLAPVGKQLGIVDPTGFNVWHSIGHVKFLKN